MKRCPPWGGRGWKKRELISQKLQSGKIISHQWTKGKRKRKLQSFVRKRWWVYTACRSRISWKVHPQPPQGGEPARGPAHFFRENQLKKERRGPNGQKTITSQHLPITSARNNHDFLSKNKSVGKVHCTKIPWHQYTYRVSPFPVDSVKIQPLRPCQRGIGSSYSLVGEDAVPKDYRSLAVSKVAQRRRGLVPKLFLYDQANMKAIS